MSSYDGKLCQCSIVAVEDRIAICIKIHESDISLNEIKKISFILDVSQSFNVHVPCNLNSVFMRGFRSRSPHSACNDGL